MIIAFILGFVGGMLNLDIIGELYSLVFLIPSIALCVRRLHDTGHSGWWYLIVLTGIGAILLLVWFLQDSQPDNQYGPSPKGYSAAPMGYGAPQGGYQAPQTPPYQGPQNNGGNQYNGPEL